MVEIINVEVISAGDDSYIIGAVLWSPDGKSYTTGSMGRTQIPYKSGTEWWVCRADGFEDLAFDRSQWRMVGSDRILYLVMGPIYDDDDEPGPDDDGEAESIEFRAFNTDDDMPLDKVKITIKSTEDNEQNLCETPAFTMAEYNRSKYFQVITAVPPKKYWDQKCIFSATRNHYELALTDPVIYDPREGLAVEFYMEPIDYPEAHADTTDEEYRRLKELQEEFYPPGAQVGLARPKEKEGVTHVAFTTYYQPLQGMPYGPAPATLSFAGKEYMTEIVDGESRVTIDIPYGIPATITGKPDKEGWKSETVVIDTKLNNFNRVMYFRNFKIGDKPPQKPKTTKNTWVIVVLFLVLVGLILKSLSSSKAGEST